MNAASWRLRALGICALVLTILLPFLVVWSRGESLMAALAGPGLTKNGPVGQQVGVTPPYADAVAAYIDEPLAVLYKDLLSRGDEVTWNPHNGLGVPLYGNWQSAIDSPLRIVQQAWPRSPFAHDLGYVLRLLVAGLGTFLLASRLGIGVAGSYAAGVAFALTGYFVRYLPMHHLSAEVVLPWLLWTTDLVHSRRHGVPALFALVAVAWTVVVGGNPQPALVAACATAIFTLARSRTWGSAGIAGVVVAAIPAVLLAAPYWLAGLEYVRVAQHHHDATIGRDAYTFAGALGFFLPEPYSVPTGTEGRTQPLYSVFAPYFGVLPVLLAVLGAGRGSKLGIWPWIVLLIFGGKLVNLPGIAWLSELPGIAQMKTFKYFYPPAALALALLAGDGVHRVATLGVSKRRLGIAIGLVVVVFAGCAVCGAMALHRLADLQVLFTGKGSTALASVLVALVALVGLGVARAPKGLVLAALVAIELLFALPTRFLPRIEPFAVPEYRKALAARAGTARVMPLLGVLMPNQNAVLGIDAITLHDGVFEGRYAQLVRAILNPNVRRWPVFTGEDLGERPAAQLDAAARVAAEFLQQGAMLGLAPGQVVDLFDPVRAHALDLCNVKWFLIPNAPGLRALVEAWPKDRCKIVHEDPDTVVVERTTALPRAFFPKRCEAVSGPEQALEKLKDKSRAPAEVACLEVAAGRIGTQPVGTSAFVETRRKATEVEVSVQTDAAGWLVISQSAYPGWRAEVDGKPADLVPAELVCTAVAVPMGRHKVRLVYEPTWRTPGRALVGFGALLLVALTLVHFRKRAARG